MNSFNETIKRFFANSVSEDDVRNLFLWLNSKKGHDEIDQLLDKSWDSFNFDDDIYVDSEKILRNIRKGIQQKKSSELNRSLTRLLPYAAILVMILGSALYFFIYRNNVHVPEKLVSDNRVISVITQNGQRSKVILPDSSIVWLNSGTTLSYNYSSEDTRSVIINGQGYFRVTSNEEKPFVVWCGELMVKVLGTKFDVSAYPENDKISVVLESGSVLLSHNRYSLDYELKPGEQADYDIKDKEIEIHDIDVEKYTSWKDGLLIFRSEPIKTVFSKLERWYNINIEVVDEEVYESIFTGTIQSESYEQIFRLIEYSCPVKYEINNYSDSESIPKIIISKK